jgi:hypothetical protein
MSIKVYPYLTPTQHLSYTPTLNFNKSKFAAIKVEEGYFHVQLSWENVSGFLSPDKYDSSKWQLRIDTLNRDFVAPLEAWYADFQNKFQYLYKLKDVKFKPLFHSGEYEGQPQQCAYLKWPNVYIAGAGAPDELPVVIKDQMLLKTPQGLKNVPTDTFVKLTDVHVKVDPSIWVRDLPEGGYQCGVSFQLKELIMH